MGVGIESSKYQSKCFGNNECKTQTTDCTVCIAGSLQMHLERAEGKMQNADQE